MNVGDFLELLTWQDFLDVAIVAIVFYNLLLLIRGTRAVQILVGLAFVAATSTLARWAHLVALETLIQKFLLILPFALVVLFQPEIRRALARFGRGPFFGVAPRKDDANLHDIVLAATTLAERRTGALIVFERKEGLRAYVENGIALDARISFDLLVSIFTPDAPLHDGAIIIQAERIAAASCFLPLTSNPELSKEHGSRHRAALGISEETDALALVVSEETGEVSLAVGGELERHLDKSQLNGRLHFHLFTDAESRTRGKR
ncbi:MAG: diadenylate cyclase CdaA [Thermoanaerobaculia bacterium]